MDSFDSRQLRAQPYSGGEPALALPQPGSQHVTFEAGERVAVQDTFERPCGTQTPFWWEAVVVGSTAESGEFDYAGRPFVELVFTDLEVQFVADGEPAVHSESGGLHRCVFLNDCTLLDADSGEELLYKPLRGERDPASELCPLQVVVLGPLPGSQLALESAAPQASASVRVM